MADQLADAFLEGVFKTRQLNQDKEQFAQMQQFRAMQLNAQQQQFQQQMGQTMDIAKMNDANEKARIAQAAERGKSQDAAQAFSIMAQGLGKEVAPLTPNQPITPQNPMMQGRPDGLGEAAPLGPANSIQLGGHILAPTTPIERMQAENEAKLKMQKDSFMQGLHDTNEGLDYVEQLTGKKMDPAIRQKINFAIAAGPAGAAIIQSMDGKPMSAEEFISEAQKDARLQLQQYSQDFIKNHQGNSMALLSDPTFLKAVNTLAAPFDRLRASGVGATTGYKEKIRLSQADTKSALNTAFAQFNVPKTDPQFLQKYMQFKTQVASSMEAQGAIMDPDAEKEFDRSLGVQPNYSATDTLIRQMTGGMNNNSVPSAPPSGDQPVIQTSPGQVIGPVKRGQ